MRASLFTNWKSRTSSLGHLLTSKEKVTKKQLEEIQILQNERDLGVNVNGNKVKFSETKITKLNHLIALRDAPDTLPDGVQTHLDGVFRHVFWGRRRALKGNQIEKGTEVETDSLQLISDLDGKYYAENKTQFSNDYLTGEPDNYQYNNITEIKSSYDLESFEKAKPTSLYTYQTIGYCWLTDKPDGELIYCLVNNPIEQLEQAIYYLKMKHNIIDTPTPEFIKEAKQVERNMIFDIEKFNDEHPSYDWYNTEFDFDIPKPLRLKRYPIEFFPEHISFIKKRIELSRKYLIEKEQLELEKIKSFSEQDYNKQIQIIQNRIKK